MQWRIIVLDGISYFLQPCVLGISLGTVSSLNVVASWVLQICTIQTFVPGVNLRYNLGDLSLQLSRARRPKRGQTAATFVGPQSCDIKMPLLVQQQSFRLLVLVHEAGITDDDYNGNRRDDSPLLPITVHLKVFRTLNP